MIFTVAHDFVAHHGQLSLKQVVGEGGLEYDFSSKPDHLD
jgi:hypothetical protein